MLCIATNLIEAGVDIDCDMSYVPYADLIVFFRLPADAIEMVKIQS